MDPNNQNTPPTQPPAEQPQADNQPAAPTAAPQPVQSPIAQQFTNQPFDDQPNIPDTWPGAFGIFNHSKQSVMLNLGFLATIYLIMIAFNLLIALVGGKEDSTFRNIGNLVYFLISIPASVMLYRGLIAGVKNKKIDFSQAAVNLLQLSLNMLALVLISYAIIAVSLLLLIIPFFFVFPRIILAAYYLIEDDLGPLEAIKASWNATKGNVGKVYGIVGASIVMALPILTLIGIPVSIYLLIMYAAAPVVLYMFVKNQKPAAEQPSSPAQSPASQPPTVQPPAPTQPAA